MCTPLIRGSGSTILTLHRIKILCYTRQPWRIIGLVRWGNAPKRADLIIPVIAHISAVILRPPRFAAEITVPIYGSITPLSGKSDTRDKRDTQGEGGQHTFGTYHNVFSCIFTGVDRTAVHRDTLVIDIPRILGLLGAIFPGAVRKCDRSRPLAAGRAEERSAFRR